MTSFPWHLLWQFTSRDILAKVKGSLLGISWLVITPMLTLLLFTFVFHGILGMKWPGYDNSSPLVFGLFLFVGLSVFQFFSDVIQRSASLILNQPNLVTKVVFPLWILPLSLTLSALLNFLISISILLLACSITIGTSWQWLWLPIVLLPLILGVAGGAWLFAALGVFVRDLGQLLSMTTTALMFLSPIFYPLSSVPTEWQFWFMLNPLTLVIEPFRALIMWHQAPEPLSLLALYVVGFGSALLGWWAFYRLQRGFADVL